MGLSKKELRKLGRPYRDALQSAVRQKRAEAVSNGTYRPRPAVFSDKRRKSRDRGAKALTTE